MVSLACFRHATRMVAKYRSPDLQAAELTELIVTIQSNGRLSRVWGPDFEVWREHFGVEVASGSGLVSVPEPATAFMLLGFMIIVAGRRSSSLRKQAAKSCAVTNALASAGNLGWRLHVAAIFAIGCISLLVIASVCSPHTALAITVHGSAEPNLSRQFMRLKMTIDDLKTRFELTGPDFSWFALGFEGKHMRLCTCPINPFDLEGKFIVGHFIRKPFALCQFIVKRSEGLLGLQ